MKIYDYRNLLKEVNERYGKYCWITFDGKNYLVEVSSAGNFITLVKCRSLSSAKRWVVEITEEEV